MPLEIFSSKPNNVCSVHLRLFSSYICRLVDNPICQESGQTKPYCTISPPSSSYSTPPRNCIPASCSSNQISSPTCQCAYPYKGTIVFRAPSFSDLANTTNYEILEKTMMQSFQASYKLPVDSISLSNPRKNAFEYLEVSLQVFPSAVDHFNRTGVSSIGFVLSNQTYKPPSFFGPYFFIGDQYQNFAGNSASINKN